MKIANMVTRRGSVLVQSLFILIWLSNLMRVERFLALYLLAGVFSVYCLWENTSSGGKASAVLWVFSGVSSLAALWGNLSVFEPVRSLLSHSNMMMSLLGGSFAVYHILLWLLVTRKEETAISTGVLWQIGAVFLWLVILIPTNSRYSVYLFCAVVGVLCLCHNSAAQKAEDAQSWLFLFAGMFSLAVVLSNYPLLTPFLTAKSLVLCALALLGGGVIGYHVLLAMMLRLPGEGITEGRNHPGRVFFAVVISVCIIDLLYLFFSAYPGILSRDSNSTMAQVLGNGPYNNTMPFWHTITVQIFVRPGMAVFGTVDAGIALFHCVQILFMAVCFGCVLMTLYQIGVPKWLLVLTYFGYACIPYNIVYSITLWKDVPFSGAGLLLVTGLYRLIKNVGKSRKLNYAMLILGAFGLSLLRTNGWYAFGVTVIVMALLTYKKHRKLLLVMVAVLIFCWVMINPLLDALNVAETDLVEAFAVPMQQVARVVAEGRPLTQEENKLLSDIFWMDKVVELYNPLSVDPIKFETFRRDQIDWIRENAGAYLRLYFQLGLKYPGDYLKAWIDETKGYWNGGYDYWIYSLTYVEKSEHPIAMTFVSLFRFLNETEVLKLFSSVGLYVWGMIGCCVVNARKKREELLLSIPMLVLLAGLWIGTPVFCEFRYAYPVILSVPLVACVTMYQKPNLDDK